MPNLSKPIQFVQPSTRIVARDLVARHKATLLCIDVAHVQGRILCQEEARALVDAIVNEYLRVLEVPHA